jgi:hypothetical protein
VTLLNTAQPTAELVQQTIQAPASFATTIAMATEYVYQKLQIGPLVILESVFVLLDGLVLFAILPIVRTGQIAVLALQSLNVGGAALLNSA